MAIKYSFIVPFYNVQDYLAECLDSLIGFDRTDYEIILINDGSQDKSKVIATEYMSRYSMIKMIEQENQGLGGARNTGIRHAKGEWLLFVDSDDYVSDTLLDAVDKHIAKLTPDDIMVLNFSQHACSFFFAIVYLPYWAAGSFTVTNVPPPSALRSSSSPL